MLVEFLNRSSLILIDPSHHTFSIPKKCFAWAATIIAGTFSLGIVQGLSAIWRVYHPVDCNDTHEEIKKLFDCIINKKDIPSSDSTTQPSNIQSFSQDDSKKSTDQKGEDLANNGPQKNSLSDSTTSTTSPPLSHFTEEKTSAQIETTPSHTETLSPTISNPLEANDPKAISAPLGQPEGSSNTISLTSEVVAIDPEELAVITIQTFFRRYFAENIAAILVDQENKYLLDYPLYLRAKSYLQSPDQYSNLPRACSAGGEAFFPEDLPVVLKRPGCQRTTDQENQEKLNGMKEAKDFCEEKHFTQLAIPKARLYNGFIIETRMPIMREIDMKSQIGLYLENLEKFDKVAIEFTSLLYQSHMNVITGNPTRSKYMALCQHDRKPRYDHFTLYLDPDDATGKMALINLKNFSTKFRCAGACEIAINFFPMHFDLILATATTFDPKIKEQEIQLVKRQQEILEYFDTIYLKHKKFIEHKGISLTEACPFELSRERRQEIADHIGEAIMKKQDPFEFLLSDIKKGLLEGENVVTKLGNFIDEEFPKYIDEVIKMLNDNDQKIVYPITLDELLSKRSIVTRGLNDSYYSKIVVTIAESGKKERIQSVKKPPGIKKLINLKKSSTVIDDLKVVESLKVAILKELEKGGEIAYYNPRLGYISHNTSHCIFY